MRIYRNLSLSLLLALAFVPNLWAQDATASADAVETTQPAVEATPEEAPPAPVEVPVVEAEAEKPTKRIQPAKRETDGGKLFIVAYIIFWLLPLYLLWVTSRRLRRLEDDLKELRGIIPDNSGGADASGDEGP